MKRTVLALAASSLLLVAGTSAFAQTAVPEGAMGGSMSAMKMNMTPSVKTGGSVGPLAPQLQGKPVLAQIHADWCPVCKAERATVDAVRAKYGDAIAFVELDVTNAKAANAAAATAKTLGLATFFDAHKAQTGTIAVINPKTGAVAATLYNVTGAAAYDKAIDAVTKQLHG